MLYLNSTFLAIFKYNLINISYVYQEKFLLEGNVFLHLISLAEHSVLLALNLKRTCKTNFESLFSAIKLELDLFILQLNVGRRK